MAETLRIVLTGGPGFGKTTIINHLEKMGYNVQHEVAREIIRQLREEQINPKIGQGLQLFSDRVIQARIAQFQKATGMSFFDRGLPDAAGFMKITWAGAPLKLREACIRNRYFTKVFVTPPWPEIFTGDEERLESLSEAIEVHQFIVENYVALGYELIEVPCMQVSHRCNFILDHLHAWKR